MNIPRVTVSCRLKYRNENGVFNFIGARYRLIDSKNNLIDSGLTDSNGVTNSSAKAYEGTKIYIELLNKSTGKWESPHCSRRQSFIANRKYPRYSIIVSNYYIQVRLETTNKVPLVNWFYVITFEDARGRKFTKRGRTDENGRTNYISAKTLRSTYYKEIFNFISKGHTRKAEVKFYPPVTGATPSRYWPVLIPVGSNKSFRKHALALTTSVTNSLTADSRAILRDLGQYRRVVLDIDLSSGSSYTIERNDNGKLFDKDMFETNKIIFQNGRMREIRIPKKFQGQLLLKRDNNLIASMPLKGLDPNKENVPIVLCISNKSTPVVGQVKSISDIHQTEPLMWHFESQNRISEGNYEIRREGDNDREFKVFKDITRALLSSLVFDGVAVPTLSEMKIALANNNRQFIWDALKKLKVGSDKKDILKFSIKISKTGKTIIVFKGYSGLRSFLTGTSYSTNNLKVGIIAAASDIKTATKYSGLRSGGTLAARSAAKGLGAFGFGLVATLDIAEFMLSDDPLNNWSDLYVTLGMDAAKTLIAGVVGTIAATFVVGSGIGIVVVGVGIGAAILTSFALEYYDKKFNVTTQAQNIVNYVESGEARYLEANKSL